MAANEKITDRDAQAAVANSLHGPTTPLAENFGRGGGSLVLRAKNGRGHWYFRYYRPSGARDLLPIGQFASAAGRPKDAEDGRFSVKEARAQALKLSGLHQTRATADVRGHFERQDQIRIATEKQKKEVEEEALRKTLALEKHSLAALMDHYCDHLDNQKAYSARSVRKSIELHILKAHPELAAKPAKQVTRRELAAIIRAIAANRLRMAGLIRSYLSAAFSLAMNAEADATAPAGLLDFCIESNPAIGIKAIPVNARIRSLNVSEFTALLHRLIRDSGIFSRLIYMCILAGGQRPTQMARARICDYDRASGTLNLFDPKGRRQEPRLHALPLAAKGRLEMERLIDQAISRNSTLVFSTKGETQVHSSSLSHWVNEFSAEMLEDNEIGESFTAKDLRRTMEHRLKAIGVDKEDRAILQSHGLGGVQTRHYGIEGFDEKRRALEKCEQYLGSLLDNYPSKKVVSIHQNAV